MKQMSVFTNENPSAKLTDLQPYTAYQITVSAENTIGTSLHSQPSDIFYTDSEGRDFMILVVFIIIIVLSTICLDMSSVIHLPPLTLFYA